MTFEDYLKNCVDAGITEFRLVASKTHPLGTNAKIYIHPLGKDGESKDYYVTDNVLVDVTQAHQLDEGLIK